MQYVVDTHALRVRLAVDGRTHGLIAKDAGIPVEEIKKVLDTGKADKKTIDKIRLAVRPKMYFSTICPQKMQPSNEDGVNKTEESAEKGPYELYCRLERLFNEYSVEEVFFMLYMFQSSIFTYMESCGFNLVELFDEALPNAIQHNIEVIKKKEGK